MLYSDNVLSYLKFKVREGGSILTDKVLEGRSGSVKWSLTLKLDVGENESASIKEHFKEYSHLAKKMCKSTFKSGQKMSQTGAHQGVYMSDR